MIKLLIIFVLLASPLFLILLNFLFPLGQYRLLFSAFAIFILVERLWETFCTSKERNITKYGGDWTLVLTSLMYFFTCLVALFEYFFLHRSINLFILVIGLTIYILSGLLRYWCVKILGEQWAIHAVGESKITAEKHILVRKGPYRYIRHPIYLGIILELVGIVLVYNSYYSMIVVLLINTPLYIQRAIYEEKSSIKRFGDEYLKFRREVPFMIPYKIFKFLR